MLEISLKKLKKLWLDPLNYAFDFEDRNGSYYDRSVDCFLDSDDKAFELAVWLNKRGWKKVKTAMSSPIIYEKSRHIIRAHKNY